MEAYPLVAMQAHGGDRFDRHPVRTHTLLHPKGQALLGGEVAQDTWVSSNTIRAVEHRRSSSKATVTIVHAHARHGLKAISKKGYRRQEQVLISRARSDSPQI